MMADRLSKREDDVARGVVPLSVRCRRVGILLLTLGSVLSFGLRDIAGLTLTGERLQIGRAHV